MSSVEFSSRASCYVFSQEFAYFFLVKRVKCSVIFLLYSVPKQLNLVPRSSRLTVQQSGNLPALLTSFFTHRKILPNLVDKSWLWWIMRGILASQKRRNIMNVMIAIIRCPQSICSADFTMDLTNLKVPLSEAIFLDFGSAIFQKELGCVFSVIILKG